MLVSNGMDLGTLDPAKNSAEYITIHIQYSYFVSFFFIFRALCNAHHYCENYFGLRVDLYLLPSLWCFGLVSLSCASSQVVVVVVASPIIRRLLMTSDKEYTLWATTTPASVALVRVAMLVVFSPSSST